MEAAAVDESDPLPSAPSSEDDETPTARALCLKRCGRPLSTCLCPYLPPSPLPTRTPVLVLHHPHELRRRVSTLPALPLSLLRCHLLSGRRLFPSSHPLLSSHRPLLLFPSPSAVPLLHPPSTPSVLVVFDGTWRHAREMAAATAPLFCGIATEVRLDEVEEGVDGESMYESELVLRKEPYKGCMSTLEAVARALRVLEPEGEGAEVERRLLDVLRAMVRAQTRHLKPVNPRDHLRKKKERAVGVKEAEDRDFGDL